MAEKRENSKTEQAFFSRTAEENGVSSILN